MKRREAQSAREEKRRERSLLESDYLLGVYDEYRMGALRFKIDSKGPFLDNNKAKAAPPWTSLREIERWNMPYWKLKRDDSENNPDYFLLVCSFRLSLGRCCWSGYTGCRCWSRIGGIRFRSRNEDYGFHPGWVHPRGIKEALRI